MAEPVARRVDRLLVGDQVQHRFAAVAIAVHRRIQRAGQFGVSEQLGDLVDRSAQRLRDILGAHRAFAAALRRERLQRAARLQHLIELAHDVHRQPHQPRLMHQRALHRLADPPAGVGRETETALGLELADRVHQAEVAFLDEVAHRQAAAQVVLGDADDQPQVVLDHRLARLEVAGARLDGGVVLLLGRQQRGAPDVAQIGLQGVGRVAVGGTQVALAVPGLALAVLGFGAAQRADFVVLVGHDLGRVRRVALGRRGGLMVLGRVGGLGRQLGRQSETAWMTGAVQAVGRESI